MYIAALVIIFTLLYAIYQTHYMRFLECHNTLSYDVFLVRVCVCVFFFFFGSPASLTPSSDIHGHALVVNIII